MKFLQNNIAVIEGDTHLGKWIQDSGRLDHDQNMLPIILSYIKPGFYVIDGGAFIGDHTIAYLNAVWPTGKVFAFEPNPEAFECLKHNCPEAICYNVGLSDTASTWSILTQNNKGATRLVPGSGVWTYQLDSLMIPRLDFIKLDVEGMELKALKGGLHLIEQFKPIILLEINEHTLKLNGTTPKELIEFTEGLGYKRKKVYESDTEDMPQFDLLFLPT